MEGRDSIVVHLLGSLEVGLADVVGPPEVVLEVDALRVGATADVAGEALAAAGPGPVHEPVVARDGAHGGVDLAAGEALALPVGEEDHALVGGVCKTGRAKEEE